MALSEVFTVKEMSVTLNEVNLMGQTALHYAVKNNLYDTAEFLIHTCKVKINVQNKMGNTPLHIAVLNNWQPIVEMLIHAKIDVLIENKEGYNCLEHSKRREHVALCEYLDPVVVHAEIWQ